ncbi:peptidoglycan recognition protein [Streptomyces longispororuber]|uniref:peptidoglycan recognition protein family protein n=1 Tax=Streptomyces longispororuber TaxID=68230 RepID=UPI0033D76357
MRAWWETVAGRLPRAGRVVLAGLPGLVAVVTLALCAVGVEQAADHDGRRRADAAHRAPRPAIVPRARWLGDLRASRPPSTRPPGARAPGARPPGSRPQGGRPPIRYDGPVLAVFVHHTDSPNGYDCADAPRIIRALAAGQTEARLFDDIGYNFLVDRCGTIYEGRAGGVDRPVVGAHTQGFNHRTTGVAAIGTFTAGTPVPRPMTEAIAALAAWKLGLADVDPRHRSHLVSSNSGSRFPAGTRAEFDAVAGHTDGYTTTCPGAALRAELPAIRERAAHLQGRTDARARAVGGR